MSNIIDSIKLSGVTYTIQGSGGGGNPTIELTQAQYDALVSAGTVSADTYYIITDATAGDLTNYYTKTETNTLLDGKADTATTYTKTEVDAALGGKQATLVSGTNVKTINNESILGSGNIVIQGGGGGGTTYSAGTNISITTGETADTINCTLPIYSGGTKSIAIGGSGNTITTNGYYNLLVGNRNRVSYSGDENILVGEGNSTNMSNYCAIFGYYNTVDRAKEKCFVAGDNNYVYNSIETAFGRACKSIRNSYSFGDSGNTLFSVGNGTPGGARHNAFEIRQNGDIYLNDGSKLQDTVSATTANTTALGGLKLVKLTQSEYDALATKDSNTLYIVTDS